MNSFYMVFYQGIEKILAFTRYLFHRGIIVWKTFVGDLCQVCLFEPTISIELRLSANYRVKYAEDNNTSFYHCCFVISVVCHAATNEMLFIERYVF